MECRKATADAAVRGVLFVLLPPYYTPIIHISTTYLPYSNDNNNNNNTWHTLANCSLKHNEENDEAHVVPKHQASAEERILSPNKRNTNKRTCQ